MRARVEYVFGAQAAMGGYLIHTIGLLRAKVKIGLMNLVCNMVRLVQWIGSAGVGGTDNHGEGAPIAA